MRLRLAIALMTMAAVTSGHSSAQAKDVECAADRALSQLIAGSDHVVLGTMNVPTEELQRQAASERPAYIEIPVEIDRSIKGDLSKAVTLRFFPRDAWYKPSLASMAELSGKPALLFLKAVDQGPAGLYFAGSTPQALQAATPQAALSVETEARRQDDALENWHIDDTLPHFAEVGRLISQLGRVDAGKQQAVFRRLEELGEPAVPAIVAQMDDRRPLKHRQISLRNRAADAFEEMRHYSPELAVDALAAILNQITGYGFGSIYGGGSERERTAAVARWRIYASDLRCGLTDS